MNAIILAAGMGRRMGELGQIRPKCLLPGPGGTLLHNALNSLSVLDIEEVVVVTGFQEADVRAAARAAAPACRIVRNPHFETTNTLYSTYLARAHLRDGFVLLNADVWFSSGVLSQILRETDDGGEGRLAIQKKRCGDEEVKVTLGPEDRILRIGKELDPASAFGEYVGIACFQRWICPAMIEAITRHAGSPSGKTLYVEAAINDVLQTRLAFGERISPDQAIEIDTPQDYAAARSLWRKLGLT